MHLTVYNSANGMHQNMVRFDRFCDSHIIFMVEYFINPPYLSISDTKKTYVGPKLEIKP